MCGYHRRRAGGLRANVRGLSLELAARLAESHVSKLPYILLDNLLGVAHGRGRRVGAARQGSKLRTSTREV